MILAQTLPLTVLLIFLECVVGGALLVLYTDVEGRVSPGFVISSGAFLAVGAGIAFLLKFGYGNAAGAMGPYVAALTLLLAGYVVLVVLKQRALAWLIGVAAVATGTVTLTQSATLQANYSGNATLASVVLAAWVGGAAVTALLLGHWYLVTPLLSPKSLTRVTEILLAGLLVQLIFLVIQLATSGTAGTPFDRALAAVNSNSFVFWFRTLVGVVFPLVLGVLTWRACHLRAMQTATGFLYIVLGCVVAGDAAAKVFLFMTSISL